MRSELQHVFEQMRANREAIGSAVWEYLWIRCAESDQIPIAEMAEGLGKTERSVSQNLRYLGEARVIGIKQIPGQANKYTDLLSGENGNAR